MRARRRRRWRCCCCSCSCARCCCRSFWSCRWCSSSCCCTTTCSGRGPGLELRWRHPRRLGGGTCTSPPGTVSAGAAAAWRGPRASRPQRARRGGSLAAAYHPNCRDAQAVVSCVHALRRPSRSRFGAELAAPEMAQRWRAAAAAVAGEEEKPADRRERRQRATRRRGRGRCATGAPQGRQQPSPRPQQGERGARQAAPPHLLSRCSRTSCVSSSRARRLSSPPPWRVARSVSPEYIA